MNAKLYDENRGHSSELVPFSYYESKIPDYFPSVPLHCHKEYEINFILSGQGEFAVGDSRFTADEGDIVIIQPNILHSVSKAGIRPVRYDTLVFNGDMLLGTLFDRSSLEIIAPLKEHVILLDPKITRNSGRYERAVRFVKELFAAAKENRAVNDLIVKSCLFGLLALLLRDEGVAPVATGGIRLSQLIRPSVEYMGEHFAEKITIAELADISHMSSSYFMKIFHRYAGMSAVEYLNQLRLKRVCEMLKNHSGNICDIAFACGFNNLSNFNRLFRKQFGIAPREYVKKMLGT